MQLSFTSKDVMGRKLLHLWRIICPVPSMSYGGEERIHWSYDRRTILGVAGFER